MLIQHAATAAATGVIHGTLRFGRINGWIMQRLLFRDGLQRKPAPLLTVRLIWPLLTQRRGLMTLVMPHGIHCFYTATASTPLLLLRRYCFYTARLIHRLARLIGKRSCVEIAAGDGTLFRFLRAMGVDITATDDYSWTGQVDYKPGT